MDLRVGNTAKQYTFLTLPFHNVVELVFDASVFVDFSNYLFNLVRGMPQNQKCFASLLLYSALHIYTARDPRCNLFVIFLIYHGIDNFGPYYC